MGVLATTDPLHTLLLGYLSDWRTQLQTWAVSGALVDAASKALVLEKVPASLVELKMYLTATGEKHSFWYINLLNEQDSMWYKNFEARMLLQDKDASQPQTSASAGFHE